MTYCTQILYKINCITRPPIFLNSQKITEILLTMVPLITDFLSYSQSQIPVWLKLRIVNNIQLTVIWSHAQCLYNQHWWTESNKVKYKLQKLKKWNFAVNVPVETKDKIVQQLARELKEPVLVILMDVANQVWP